MDVQAIDGEYNALQQQAQQTVQLLQALGGKLQAAANNGDGQAREWLLDLRELALSFRAEQDRTQNLLGAIHNYVASAQTQVQPAPAGGGWMQQPAPQGGFAPQAVPQGGGMFGGFLNSGIGRALEMGAGFGIGDEIIKDIF